VVPASEVDLLWALEASPEQLRLVSYAQRGTDLLLETLYGPLPPHFEEHLLESSALAGYRILLAHPQAEPQLPIGPERLAELVRRGVLVQITVGSLAASPRRSRSARLAHDLLREGLAHVIASDAHSAEGAVRAPKVAGLPFALAGCPERLRPGRLSQTFHRCVTHACAEGRYHWLMHLNRISDHRGGVAPARRNPSFSSALSLRANLLYE
jgi:Capsular polysaccharide synthesis, CpsB/CapC